MRDSRRRYRPGPCGGFSPPQAVRHVVRRRSRPSGIRDPPSGGREPNRRPLGCVGVAAASVCSQQIKARVAVAVHTIGQDLDGQSSCGCFGVGTIGECRLVVAEHGDRVQQGVEEGVQSSVSPASPVSSRRRPRRRGGRGRWAPDRGPRARRVRPRFAVPAPRRAACAAGPTGWRHGRSRRPSRSPSRSGRPTGAAAPGGGAPTSRHAWRGGRPGPARGCRGVSSTARLGRSPGRGRGGSPPPARAAVARSGPGVKIGTRCVVSQMTLPV